MEGDIRPHPQLIDGIRSQIAEGYHIVSEPTIQSPLIQQYKYQEGYISFTNIQVGCIYSYNCTCACSAHWNNAMNQDIQLVCSRVCTFCLLASEHQVCRTRSSVAVVTIKSHITSVLILHLGIWYLVWYLVCHATLETQLTHV